MSFWDEIYELRKHGLIPKVWARRHLRPFLAKTYMPNSIDTIPSDQSMARNGEPAGDYVKKGQEPKAWRVGRGEFQLVVDPDDDKATQDAERQRAESYAHVARAIAAGAPYPLRGLPLKYDRPLDPVALDDWDALK